MKKGILSFSILCAMFIVMVCTGYAAGTAALSLSDLSASMTQTSDTEWTLEKTGSVNQADSTVTWTVTATEGAAVGGHLVINGQMTITNKGSEGATIGNIVVNLQSKGSKWVTRSSNIADATYDDAATTANVVASASSEKLSSFTENAASGQLLFMDLGTNTIFPLVPQVTIAPGEIRNLLFSTSFDNNVLGLADGTPTRAEIIITFGNAIASTSSASNVDINGNGIIDADEEWVRSVPKRLELMVPAETPGNQTVTLSDTIDDITATGTVTFSNASFNLGSTSGTVTVHYDGGTTGGAITNCAHLTGTGSTSNVGGSTFTNVNALDLIACDTQTIGATVCTPGMAGCGWQNGNLTTWGQSAWGNGGIANAILLGSYGGVYGGSGQFMIGWWGGFVAIWTNPTVLSTYLPATGTPAPLTATLTDPLTTASGQFGGDVAALKLNVDFSDAGVLTSNIGLAFGNLTLCNFTTLPALNGLSVRQFLDTANTALGGGSASYSVADLDTVAGQLNGAFLLGTPSTFAQTQLCNVTPALITPTQGPVGSTFNINDAMQRMQQGDTAVFYLPGDPLTRGVPALNVSISSDGSQLNGVVPDVPATEHYIAVVSPTTGEIRFQGLPFSVL